MPSPNARTPAAHGNCRHTGIIKRCKARNSRIVDADASIVERCKPHLRLDRVAARRAWKAAVGSGCDDLTRIFIRDIGCRIEGKHADFSGPRHGNSSECFRFDMVWDLGRRRTRPHGFEGLRTRHVGAHAAFLCRLIGVGDDAACDHVIAVADPCRAVIDGRGRQPMRLEEFKRADTGAVHANPGVMADQGANPAEQGIFAHCRTAMGAGADMSACFTVREMCD